MLKIDCQHLFYESKGRFLHPFQTWTQLEPLEDTYFILAALYRTFTFLMVLNKPLVYYNPYSPCNAL